MMLLPLLANAESVEINGIYYNLSTETNTAEVTYGPDYYSGDIVIPETVNYEGISYSVTSIGESAFAGCRSLTSVTIGNSVASIGWYAFNRCSSLTSITIGSSVTSIGNKVFEDCSNLTFIRVDEGNPVFDSRENCNAIVMTENNELIVGCKNTIIPNSVTSIGESAFEGCSSLTSIEIPNSVTSIGFSAFRECIGLTSITIPNSITTIGEHAFFACI